HGLVLAALKRRGNYEFGKIGRRAEAKMAEGAKEVEEAKETNEGKEAKEKKPEKQEAAGRSRCIRSRKSRRSGRSRTEMNISGWPPKSGSMINIGLIDVTAAAAAAYILFC
ncbi:5617_t:CDS:2, partial [Racocetra persica]